MEVRPNRTDSYVCSLDPMSCVDMEILNAIRRSVAAMNKDAPIERERWGLVKRCKRVTVKGREPIEKQVVNTRHWWATPRMAEVGYNMFGDIVGNKYTNSKRLDIYIHNDFRIVGDC